MYRNSFAVLAASVLAAAGPTVLAQQHGHEEEEGHGKPAEFRMPTTYRDAVKEIEYRLHEIEELMEAKQLDKVHAQADVIKKVGNQIGQLALKADSGVPKEAVKDVNQAGRALAAKFDAIDKVADAGDAAGTQRVYDEMVTQAATLQLYLPRSFVCPMKCEADKSYVTAGQCPKCNMNLKEVGRHGGQLAAARDGYGQLEATLSADGELCIYAYDAQASPVAADRVAAEVRVGAKGAAPNEMKTLAVAPNAARSCLVGHTEGAIRPPFAASVSVDFKDGQKPRMFSFGFDGPTQAAHDSDEDHDDKGHDQHKP